MIAAFLGASVLAGEKKQAGDGVTEAKAAALIGAVTATESDAREKAVEGLLRLDWRALNALSNIVAWEQPSERKKICGQVLQKIIAKLKQDARDEIGRASSSASDNPKEIARRAEGISDCRLAIGMLLLAAEIYRQRGDEANAFVRELEATRLCSGERKPSAGGYITLLTGERAHVDE